MMSPSTSLLSPAQAARALGLSESSVRRLCDDGALETRRTAGGHRRIPVSAVTRYARDSLGAVPMGEVVGAAGRGGRLAEPRVLAARATSALRRGDAGLLARVLDGVQPAEDSAFVADRVLAPALAELGRLWCEGELAIYEEHRASELVLAYAARRRSLFAPTRPKRRALCAALAGDPSSLPSALAAWVLAELGFEAVLLGANTPAETLAEAVAALRPALVVVSLSHVPDAADCSARCQALYAATSAAGALLAVGGRAATPALRAALRADFFGDTLAHLRDFAAKQLTDVR